MSRYWRGTGHVVEYNTINDFKRLYRHIQEELE